MNDDLQKALAEILNKTTQGVEAGVGFLQRELPEVVQQLLVWHGVKSGVFFAAAVVCFAICVFYCRKAWKWTVAEDEEAGIYLCIMLTIGAAISALAAFRNLDWLQILLAPKLYLIEYAASLVK